MGYHIEIELKNVRFKKDDWKEIKEILKDWNVKELIPNSCYSRFDTSLDSPIELLEDLRYSAKIIDDYIHIEEFTGEKLGSDTELFEKLAPFLEDCEILYEGEDGRIWKQVISNHQIITAR